MLDLDALLAPVPGDLPTGQNTEYEGLGALERLAAGTPGTLDPVTQEYVGAEEPDWRKVRSAAQELLGQTKDLRVGVLLVRAELAMSGLAGFGQGLTLVSRLLSDYWDGVHPQLDREEDDDPIERLNALANLVDSERLLPALRGTVIAESRQVGRFTVRDLDYAAGRVAPPAGTQAPGLELIGAAWRTGEGEANAGRRQGVEEGLSALRAIEQVFREQAGQVPNLDVLRQMLGRIRDFYGTQGAGEVPSSPAGDLSTAPPAATGAPGTAAAAVPVATPPAAGKGSGALTTRADAVRLLLQVSEFLRRTEPSSPAPMFVDRAVRLLQMDFAAIVRELMPDARERIELLGGISLEPPGDGEA